MTLNKFLERLIILQKEGYGNMQVYYTHGSSGDCGELSTPTITDYVGECGPFDLTEGELYISIYAGN